MNASYIAVIPAAGSGSRSQSTLPKQYQCIARKPLLFYTLLALSKVAEIERLVVVIAPQDSYFDQFDWSMFNTLKVLRVGGKSRLESVRQGIAVLDQQHPIQPHDWLLVHDSIRCCIKPEDIKHFIRNLAGDEIGGIMAVPLSDTLKKVDAATFNILKTVDRSNLWLAQTPQMFRAHLLINALEQVSTATDEASAIERLGYQPKVVHGVTSNIKVTYPDDLNVVTRYLTTAGLI